ncbi:MAG TPA: phosphatase PAP2 family protein, partial [Candidatus Sulfopaludibacter sp.]|jgi:hypothetical protein|nr:phosphatase PAP2 family protein [Candidatus Sulfopaludibacter sp.]
MVRSLDSSMQANLAIVGSTSPRGRLAFVPALLAVMVLCGQAYLVAGRNFSTILETPFLPYCLIGAFAIHFWTHPSAAERWWTVGLALAGTSCFVLFSRRFEFNWPCSIACGAFFGLASLAVLAVQTVRLRGTAQQEKLHTLIAGSVFGYSALFIAYILNLTTRLHPQTYDLYLYAADAGFGLPLCAWIGNFVARRPLLLHSCSLVYESLPLAVSLLYAYQRSGKRVLPVRVLPAFLGGGAAAYVLYNILPAAGPHYVFGGAFPNSLPSAAQAGLHMVTLGEAARNAVPSMHLACALLIFWCCRALSRWVRAAAALYLVLTILATIGFGEHYVVDLIAAVPYALALAAICASSGWRKHRRAVFTGLASTIAWILLLRFATPLFHSAPFSWSISLGTIAISLFFSQNILKQN